MFTVLVIEVGTQQMTGVVLFQHIEADNVATVLLFSLQVVVEIRIGERQQLTVWTIRTILLGLVA